MTKETSLPPIVGLRRIAVSRPTSFAEVRQDDFSTNRAVSTNAPSTREHAQSPEARSAGRREGRISGARQPDWAVLRRRPHGGPRDLANGARYDEADLSLDDLNDIADGTMVVFDWLASRAFHVLEQTVFAGDPRATTLQAHNTFPAPRLGKRDFATLEGVARTVLLARSHLMAGSFADLYADLPEQLAWAHAQLDTTADRLLGIADDEQAAAVTCRALRRHLETPPWRKNTTS